MENSGPLCALCILVPSNFTPLSCSSGATSCPEAEGRIVDAHIPEHVRGKMKNEQLSSFSNEDTPSPVYFTMHSLLPFSLNQLHEFIITFHTAHIL